MRTGVQGEEQRWLSSSCLSALRLVERWEELLVIQDTTLKHKSPILLIFPQSFWFWGRAHIFSTVRFPLLLLLMFSWVKQLHAAVRYAELGCRYQSMMFVWLHISAVGGAGCLCLGTIYLWQLLVWWCFAEVQPFETG